MGKVLKYLLKKEIKLIDWGKELLEKKIRKTESDIKRIDEEITKSIKEIEEKIKQEHQKKGIDNIEELEENLKNYEISINCILGMALKEEFNENKLITYYLQKKILEIYQSCLDINSTVDFMENLTKYNNTNLIQTLILNKAQFSNIIDGHHPKLFIEIKD